MIVIVYKHPDGGSTAGIPAPEVPPEDARREPGDEPVYCVRGPHWNDCMQAYYDVEGFGTYRPMEGFVPDACGHEWTRVGGHDEWVCKECGSRKRR